MEDKNLGGRPRKFPDPESLEAAIDSYFQEYPDHKQHTLTGLCIHLGTTKETLDDYKVREGYQHIVKMAKLRIEHAYELSLRENGKTGDIFALKNFGWSDTQQIQHAGKDGGPIVSITSSDDEILKRFYSTKYKEQPNEET